MPLTNATQGGEDLRKWLASLLVVTMLVLVFVATPSSSAAPAAFSHEELARKTTIVLRKQLHESGKRNIDKLVVAGELTSQDGERLKRNSEVLHEWYLEHGFDESPSCPHCGDGEFELRDHEYTRWLTVGFSRCSRNPMYNDRVQQRHVINILTCDNCGINYCPLSLESRVVCSH